jgi:hypothetical protein
MVGSEPAQRLERDSWRRDMRPVELAVLDIITTLLELRHDALAAPLDRQHRVTRAVRNEDS